jgi:hypothetical protein
MANNKVKFLERILPDVSHQEKRETINQAVRARTQAISIPAPAGNEAKPQYYATFFMYARASLTLETGSNRE